MSFIFSVGFCYSGEVARSPSQSCQQLHRCPESHLWHASEMRPKSWFRMGIWNKLLSGSGDIKIHPFFSPHLPAHPVEIGELQHCTPLRCKHDLGVNRPSLFPQETLPTCLNTSNHFKKWVGCYGKTCIISACFFLHWRNEFSVFKPILYLLEMTRSVQPERNSEQQSNGRLSLHIILKSYCFS